MLEAIPVMKSYHTDILADCIVSLIYILEQWGIEKILFLLSFTNSSFNKILA